MFIVLRWLLKAILIFVAVSVLWVGVYRFVPPPFTFTMLGDVIGGRPRGAIPGAAMVRPDPGRVNGMPFRIFMDRQEDFAASSDGEGERVSARRGQESIVLPVAIRGPVIERQTNDAPRR